jgi:dienelactone hydrolase
VVRAPVVRGVEQAFIDVTVFRPEGAGPFPLLVLSHGSPRDAAERRREGRQRLPAQSARFLRMGFAVLVPTRRYSAGLETARDLRAAVDAVRAEPWADATRIVLAGQSAGGFGSLAAASQPFTGLAAVVNFAGGRGSQGPDDVCGESRLVEAVGRYGAGVQVPTMWIYSVNDRFFGPPVARRMHAAFTRAGGKAEFLEAPAVGLDGHAYFSAGMDDWAPRVETFLRSVGAAR